MALNATLTESKSPTVASDGYAPQRARPTFQMQADARLLYQRGYKTTVGDIVTYEDFSAVVGRPIKGGFGPLQTARRALRRDHQIVFDTVRRVGLKRLSDAEKVKLVDRTAARLRKAARRGIDTLGTVENFNGLTRENQNKHNAALSILSVVSAITSNGAISKVEAVVEKARKELPMAETLKALGLA